MDFGAACVLGRRVGPADELRAKVSQVCGCVSVCLEVWLGCAWDWYALVTRLPGVVVGSQGGRAGRL